MSITLFGGNETGRDQMRHNWTRRAVNPPISECMVRANHAAIVLAGGLMMTAGNGCTSAPSGSAAPTGSTAHAVLLDLMTNEPIEPRLDPQAAAVLARVAARPAPTTLSERRAAFDAIFKELSGAPEPIHMVEDRTIDGPSGPLVLRVYRPSDGVLPALVYTHGGGFNKGGLASHDAALRALSNRAGCVVIAVDYRRSPEHQYPIQTDEAFAALCWVADPGNARAIGVDANRLAVGGDSVGGNLAAVTAIRARDAGGPSLVFQLLIYPVTDATLSSDSWRAYAQGPWLSRDGEWQGLHEFYLPKGQDPKHPHVSPLFTPDLRGLPPTLVIDAEFDPYRDEGQAYAKRLGDAGVPTEAAVYPGMIHDFFLMAGVTDAGARAIDQSAAALRAAFTEAIGTTPTAR